MKGLLTISATEAKNRLGEYIDHAHRSPVCIQKAGRDTVVIVDITEYERLTAMENAYWCMQAEAAEAVGFLGQEESMAVINARLTEL